MALWLAFRDVIDLVTPFEDIIMDGAPAPATAFSDVATTALVSAMTENADGSGSLLIASSTIPHGLATAFTVSAQGALPSWKLCDLKTNKSVAVSASGEATWSSSAEGGSLFLLAAITPCHAVARAAPAAVVWANCPIPLHNPAVHKGQDFNHPDRELSTSTNITSWGACCDLCTAASKCYALTWVGNDSATHPNTCWLRASVGSLMAHPHPVTYSAVMPGRKP